MNRGNMGKQIATAPKSKPKKVKKMMFGGMASAMPGGPGAPMPGGRPMGGPNGPMGGPNGLSQGDMRRMERQQERGMRQMERGGMPDRALVSQPGGIQGTAGPRPALSGVMAPMPPMQSDLRAAMAMQAARAAQATPTRMMGSAPETMQRAMPMKKGGVVKKMAKGGMTRGDGCCMKGNTKGKMY